MFLLSLVPVHRELKGLQEELNLQTHDHQIKFVSDTQTPQSLPLVVNIMIVPLLLPPWVPLT